MFDDSHDGLSVFAALWGMWADRGPPWFFSGMQHRAVRLHRWEDKKKTNQLFISCYKSWFLKDALLSPAGQTVELLERPSERPGWCLVRTTERSPPQEGLVPSSVLCVSHSRSSVEMDCFFSSGKGRRDKVQIHSFCFVFVYNSRLLTHEDRMDLRNIFVKFQSQILLFYNSHPCFHEIKCQIYPKNRRSLYS